MSVWDRSDWTGGFPFSPTRLSPLGRGIRGQGGQIDVNGPQLQTEGTAPTPRAQVLGCITVPDALTIRVAPASRRFGPRQASVRLMPAGAFSWGGYTLPVQPRTRPEHVLIWVTEGRLRIDFPCNSSVLSAGDVRFIPAGTAFAARPMEGLQGQVLLITPALTALVDPPLPRTVVAGCVGSGAAMLSATLTELVEEAGRSADHRTLGCYLNMLSLRLSRLDPERDHRPDPGTLHPDRPLVDRFLELAGIEMGSCRTLADLAQDMGTTLTHLDHACIAARGHRAIDLLHELRVERAAELLRHTDRPVPRLAQDLGYASHAHFTRAFAAATGRTPEAYRAQMRTSPPQP